MYNYKLLNLLSIFIRYYTYTCTSILGIVYMQCTLHM